MFVLALIGCGLMVLGANRIVRSRLGFEGAFCFALMCFFSPMVIMMFSAAVAINSLLLLLVTVVCAAAKSDVKTYRTWSLISAAVAMLGAGAMALVDLREQKELRAKYPFRSMADRLAYETKPIDSGEAKAPRALLDERATARLDALETTMRDRGLPYRSMALRQVHASSVERFVNSPGFGIGRMTHMGEHWIKRLEDSPPVPLPRPPSQYPVPAGDMEEPPLAGLRPTRDDALRKIRPPESELWSSHSESVLDFANPERFGLVKDREHVAGFQSHRFRFMPRVDFDSPEWAGNVKWSIVRLELVSLLKHAQPRVYISQNLPRMDQLKDAPTRKLTPVERRAVGELFQGKDLVVDDQRNRIHMVGSLRAIQQCLQCHDTDRGSLLGAFSYELVRSPRLDTPRKQEARNASLEPI